MEEVNTNKKKEILNIIHDYVTPVILLVFGLSVILYYIIGPSRGYMTADSFDSLRWGYETYKSGKLISSDFYYAAIQPFGGNLFFLPFIAIFGYSIKAQIWGLSFFFIVLYLSLYYFFRTLKISRNMSLLFNALFFLLMASSPKLREIMFEHIFYYNLGILFFLIGFSLTFRIIEDGGFNYISIKEDKKEGLSFIISIFLTLIFIGLYLIFIPDVLPLLIVTIIMILVVIASYIITHLFKLDFIKNKNRVRILFLSIFSFVSAIDGLQTLITFTAPILIALFIIFILDRSESKLFTKNKLNIVYVALTIFIFSLVGYLSILRASNNITAGYQDAYSMMSSDYDWLDNAINIPHQILSLFGITSSGNESLVSIPSIVNMLRIVGLLVFLIVPIYGLFRFKDIKNINVKYVVLGHIFVSAFIIYAAIFGVIGNANWRFTPLIATAIISSFVLLNEFMNFKPIGQRLAFIFIILISLVSFTSLREIIKMEKDYGRDNVYFEVASNLESRDLKYGAANFWFAEAISAISDSVSVTNIKENESRPVAYRYQVNESEFSAKDTDKYFLILSELENRRFSYYLSTNTYSDSFIIDVSYDIRGYVGDKIYVYIFDDYFIE